MKKNIKRILFYAANISFRGIREWLPVASALKSAGCVPVFAVDYHCSKEWIDNCSQLGIECIDISPKRKDTLYDNSSVPVLSRKTVSGRSPLSWCSEVLQQIVEKYNRIRSHRLWMRKFNPDVIVSYSDTNAECALVAKAACDLGIPLIVHLIPGKLHLPFAALDQRVASPFYKQYYSPHGFMNSMAAKLFPRAATKYHGQSVFQNRSEDFTASALLGALPGIPASSAGGSSSVVCASSLAIRQCLEHEGVAPEKIVVTGCPSYDMTARCLQSRHETKSRHAFELGCDADKPWLLLNIPSKYLFPYLFGKDEAFSRLEAMFGMLQAGWNGEVILTLHPGWAFDVSEMAARHGFFLAQHLDISALFATCDLFLTEVMSSTVHQATGARKPTVLLDYEESDYENVLNREPRRGYFEKVYGIPGITIVREPHELAGFFQAVAADSGMLERLSAQLDANAQTWAPMDGKCTDRLAAAILDVIPHSRQAP